MTGPVLELAFAAISTCAWWQLQQSVHVIELCMKLNLNFCMWLQQSVHLIELCMKLNLRFAWLDRTEFEF